MQLYLDQSIMQPVGVKVTIRGGGELLLHIRRRAISSSAISPWRMQSSISYARIKRCALPFHNQRRGANGSNEPRRWQQISQTISGVSKNYFRIVSLLPRTKTSFTA